MHVYFLTKKQLSIKYKILNDNQLNKLNNDKAISITIQKQSRIYYALINNKCVVSQKSKRNYFEDLIIELKEDFCAGLLHTLESENWKNYSQNTAEKFKLQSTNLINNYDLFNS